MWLDWPDRKTEATRYTDLSRANGLDLPAGTIDRRTTLPGTSVHDNGTYTLDHVVPAARAADTLALTVARDTEVTLIETLRSAAPGIGVARQQAEIVLEDGARLTHIRLQHLNTEAFHWSSSSLTLGRAAQYRQITLNLGAALARQDLTARLTAAGASFNLAALQLLEGSQQGDITTQVLHEAPQTRSQQLVKNVLTSSARGVYQGRIRVAPGAQKTDGRQQSRALLLSPQAEMDTKPELEIFADDVKCSHGAAVGALDDAALFYLRARGIAQAQARSLLIAAFTGEVLEQAPADHGITLEQEARAWLSRL